MNSENEMMYYNCDHCGHKSDQEFFGCWLEACKRGDEDPESPVCDACFQGWDDWTDPSEEARDYECGAEYGDPRRCPHHPHVKTSSDDGIFDAPCGECEAIMDRWEEPAPAWMRCKSNKPGVGCQATSGFSLFCPAQSNQKCDDDCIPF